MFFFDEAHLLFNDAPQALLEKIEQVVRLIRSKGVGVYFVTQNPLDVPDTVLGQLGNRVQHALRAFTPRDQKAVKTAATHPARQSRTSTRRRPSPRWVSAKRWCRSSTRRAGPAIVERALILAPGSRIGPITPEERKQIIKSSLVYGHYEQGRRSRIGLRKAQGRSGRQARRRPAPNRRAPAPAGGGGVMDVLGGILMGSTGPRGGRREGVLEAAAKSAARSIGSQAGREILRGVLGSLLGGGATRRR